MLWRYGALEPRRRAEGVQMWIELWNSAADVASWLYGVVPCGEVWSAGDALPACKRRSMEKLSSSGDELQVSRRGGIGIRV